MTNLYVNKEFERSDVFSYFDPFKIDDTRVGPHFSICPTSSRASIYTLVFDPVHIALMSLRLIDKSPTVQT